MTFLLFAFAQNDLLFGNCFYSAPHIFYPPPTKHTNQLNFFINKMEILPLHRRKWVWCVGVLFLGGIGFTVFLVEIFTRSSSNEVSAPISTTSPIPSAPPTISGLPSVYPSLFPSASPSLRPTASPTDYPSLSPSAVPSLSSIPSSSPPTGSPTNYTDIQRNVLMALYEATNGANWRRDYLWWSDADICTWSGLACSGNGDIIKLDLDFNYLEGVLPTELGLLQSLQTLWVGENSLTGPIPTELGQLQSLLRLHMYGNDLTGPVPTELGRLQSLQHVIVYGNDLTGPIPSELGQLQSLQTLWVAYNGLTGSIPTELGQLQSLRQVIIYDNDLTGAMPDEVCALRDSNGGALISLPADCQEVLCSCCTRCCIDGGGCSDP
mmetsp:Transcript_847/g.1335  ORF Transcript_847/g.1335 Transcript_847/m.1335 type:complete len:379 (-) Transcript_847:123-1259(-)